MPYSGYFLLKCSSIHYCAFNFEYHVFKSSIKFLNLGIIFFLSYRSSIIYHFLLFPVLFQNSHYLLISLNIMNRVILKSTSDFSIIYIAYKSTYHLTIICCSSGFWPHFHLCLGISCLLNVIHFI